MRTLVIFLKSPLMIAVSIDCSVDSFIRAAEGGPVCQSTPMSSRSAAKSFMRHRTPRAAKKLGGADALVRGRGGSRVDARLGGRRRPPDRIIPIRVRLPIEDEVIPNELAVSVRDHAALLVER